MKFSEYQRSRSLTLIKGHSYFNVKTCFSQKQLGEVHMKAKGRMEMKIYTNELRHLTSMAAMSISGKGL